MASRQQDRLQARHAAKLERHRHWAGAHGGKGGGFEHSRDWRAYYASPDRGCR